MPAARQGVPPYTQGTPPCAPTSSLDPVQRARNITALGNVGRPDRELLDAFLKNPEAIAAEAEAAYARLAGRDAPPLETELDVPEGPTEIVRTVRARRVQSFFRAAVLASYEYRCALSGIALPDLLNASHIVPWKTDTARRADPRNGIALNALYDRAFDRGLITFDALRVVLSPRLRTMDPAAPPAVAAVMPRPWLGGALGSGWVLVDARSPLCGLLRQL